MSLDKESNGYIVIFLLVMVLIVSISLSAVNSALKPTINRNQVVDTKSQILKSVIDIPEGKEPADLLTEEFVLSEYDSKITEYAVDAAGNVIDEAKLDQSPFQIARDFKKELKKDPKDRRYPVFKYDGSNGTFYIIPLSGLGLWDAIWGYLAVKEDYVTVRGTAFDHQAETPGLGARITEDWFQQQFGGKKLYGEDGEYQLQVLKGEGNPNVGNSPYLVDGLSGATLTAQGVDAMLAKCVSLYEPYFEKTKN